MASCPTATKSEVAGYIAMMFALTCRAHVGKEMHLCLCGTHARSECEITKDRDNFVGDSCGANGRANDDVHALLRVGLKLVEDGE